MAASTQFPASLGPAERFSAIVRAAYDAHPHDLNIAESEVYDIVRSDPDLIDALAQVALRTAIRGRLHGINRKAPIMTVSEKPKPRQPPRDAAVMALAHIDLRPNLLEQMQREGVALSGRQGAVEQTVSRTKLKRAHGLPLRKR